MAKTIAQLRTEAQNIKNATITGENTATRVGGTIEDVVDYLDTEVGGGSFATGEEIGDVSIFDDPSDLTGKTNAQKALMLPNAVMVDSMSLFSESENLQDDALLSSMAGNLTYNSNGTFATSSNRVVILSSIIPNGCTKVSASCYFTFALCFCNADSSVTTPYNGMSVSRLSDSGYMNPRRLTQDVVTGANRVFLLIQTSSISDAVAKSSITFHSDGGTQNRIDEIENSMKAEAVVDLSGYAELAQWVNDSASKWAGSSAVHSKLIPCRPDTDYRIVVPTGKTVRWGYMKDSSHANNTYANYCDDWGGNLLSATDTIFHTPTDCNYIYFLIRVNQSDFVLPSQLYEIYSKIRDFDELPQKDSQNAITSGGVFPSSYFGIEWSNVLGEVTESMWAKTAWDGTTYASSGSGATILFPHDINDIDGCFDVMFETGNFACQILNLADPNAMSLTSNIAVNEMVFNSGYVSGRFIGNYPVRERNRIAIQIQSSTGTASGDLARLKSVFMSLKMSDKPINGRTMASEEASKIVTYPYSGEVINLRQFSAICVGNEVGNQGSACYNGVVFGFSSNSMSVKIYDMNTGNSTTATITTGESPSNSHNNAAFFTDEFYSPSDKFPLLGTSDDINLMARLFRVQELNGVYTLTLVQTITFVKGSTANAAGNTYTYGEGKIWSLAEIVSGGTRTWYLYDFAMPTLSQGNVTLTTESTNEHSFVNNNNYQGMCYHGGKLYMPQKTSASDIIVVDPSSNSIVTTLPISKAVSREIEDTWIYRNELYFTTNNGLIFKVKTY